MRFVFRLSNLSLFYGSLFSSTAFLFSTGLLVGVPSTGPSKLDISLSLFILMVEFQASGEREKNFFLASSNYTAQIAIIAEGSISKVRLIVCFHGSCVF